MKSGIELISAERERQVSQEGWDATHDDQHRYQEIAINAALLCAAGTDAEVTIHSDTPDWLLLEKHKGDRIRQLVIAGALIAAEIDRRQRL